jgi:hypothetical protein
VDGTGSGLCSMAGFSTGDAELSCSPNIGFVGYYRNGL